MQRQILTPHVYELRLTLFSPYVLMSIFWCILKSWIYFGEEVIDQLASDLTHRFGRSFF
jgi:hypothetical protein